ncbi:hypothetical protein SBADM41S_11178 [Streptomyces badius]
MTLGVLARVRVRLPGSKPAGGAGEVEVASGDESGALFEQGAQEGLRGARRYGGLQQHGGVRAQPGGQGAGGVAERGEVDGAVGAERGGGADHGGTDPAQLGGVGGGPEAAREHAADLGGREGALDGAPAGSQLRVRAGIGVVADGVDSGGHGGLGERQAEVTESDDGEVCGHTGRPPKCGERRSQLLWTAQCQTRRKYDLYVALCRFGHRGVVHRRWLNSGSADRIERWTRAAGPSAGWHSRVRPPRSTGRQQ